MINRKATPQPCRRRKGAGWRLSSRKKGFVGFASFVTKQILWNTGKTEPAY